MALCYGCPESGSSASKSSSSGGAAGRNKQAYSEYVRNVVQRSRTNATAKYAVSRRYEPPCLIRMAFCYGWPESASSASRYFIFRWRCWQKQTCSKYKTCCATKPNTIAYASCMLLIAPIGLTGCKQELYIGNAYCTASQSAYPTRAVASHG